MSVPDDATLQAVIDEVAGLGFATGTAAQNLAAMSIAWELAEYAIGTNLLTGTACEEYNWPTGWVDWDQPFRMVQLRKTRLTSITSVTIHHELFDCACGEELISGCATIYNHDRSEIALTDCLSPGGLCGCSTQHPFKSEICYVAGLYNTVGDLADSIVTALGLLFSWWFNLLATGGSDASSGFLQSWRSMDYSESYGFITKNIIGTSPQAAAAWMLLRRFRIYRIVAIRGYYPSQLRGPPGTVP